MVDMTAKKDINYYNTDQYISWVNYGYILTCRNN